MTRVIICALSGTLYLIYLSSPVLGMEKYLFEVLWKCSDSFKLQEPPHLKNHGSALGITR